MNWIVPADAAGVRLDQFLESQLPALSRMHLRSAVKLGKCLVDGAHQPRGHKLAVGQRVEIDVDPDAPTSMTAEAIPLEILHEDDNLLVVVKPAGMLVHPTKLVRTGTLANALAYHLNRGAGPVVRAVFPHRLDRETSGLMVVAKNVPTGRALSLEFARGRIAKRYIAELEGVVTGNERLIDAPIGRYPDRRPQWNVQEDGKPSETRLRVVERRTDSTVVDLEPLTGRTNQLRIHCAVIGHAIVGDPWYGSRAASRLRLHASRLSGRLLPGVFESAAGFR